MSTQPDNETKAALEHVDLMVDEFKRIRSCYRATEEIKGLCDRAIRNTYQHFPVIVQRDNAQQALAEERTLHNQTRTVVEELNTICTDLKNAGGPPFIRSEAIRLLREDQAQLRAQLAEARKDSERLDWLQADPYKRTQEIRTLYPITPACPGPGMVRGAIDAARNSTT